jgi:hypothetical protein
LSVLVFVCVCIFAWYITGVLDRMDQKSNETKAFSNTPSEATGEDSLKRSKDS